MNYFLKLDEFLPRAVELKVNTLLEKQVRAV